MRRQIVATSLFRLVTASHSFAAVDCDSPVPTVLLPLVRETQSSAPVLARYFAGVPKTNSTDISGQQPDVHSIVRPLLSSLRAFR